MINRLIWVDPRILNEKVRKLEAKLAANKKKYIDPLTYELGVLETMLKKRKPFKQGDLVTDGYSYIKIGWVRDPTWTAENSHGSKNYEYRDCSFYRAEGSKVSPFTHQNNICHSWFKECGHLENFRLVDPMFINKILFDLLITK